MTENKPAATGDREWVPVFRCCWCGEPFITRIVDTVAAWVCPTRACFERQMVWKMNDTSGALFYLPMPRGVELEEAIASQQYGAITLGGERNTGKSVIIRRICYRQCQKYKDFAVLFLRRTFPELQLNHMRFALKESVRLGAKYSARDMTFPKTRSEIMFRHCHETDDYKNYIGGDVDLIVFEQLEEFERIQFTEITPSTGRTRARPDWRGLVLCGENPGGPLSAFVDELFISKNPKAADFPDYDPTQYHFITANLEDNPYADPRYVNNLATLGAARREMFRFGRRDIFPLQFFKTFLRVDRVQALTIPPDVPRLLAVHWGFFKPGIVLWAVVLPDGRLYIEHEYPFIETLATQVAKDVVALSTAWGITTEFAWGNPPSDLSDDDIGENTFETLYRNGLPVIRSAHDPVNGWQRLQHWFEPMPIAAGEQATLIVSPECDQVIRTVPSLLQDEKYPEDVNASGATEAAKALRYLVMSRPEPPSMTPLRQGRDLSRLDEKTRAEIEYLARCDNENAADADPYSMGQLWDTGER